MPRVSIAKKYWGERRDFMYLKYVNALVKRYAKTGASIVDVGSHGCPYLEPYSWAGYRISVDLVKPYASQKVVGVTTDFLLWEPDRLFDLALCLQVLEHVPEPSLFLAKLFATAKRVIISVPYMWPAHSHKSHLHDLIDETTVENWAGKKPDLIFVVSELNNGPKARRVIAYFDSKSRSQNADVAR